MLFLVYHSKNAAYFLPHLLAPPPIPPPPKLCPAIWKDNESGPEQKIHIISYADVSICAVDSAVVTMACRINVNEEKLLNPRIP